MGPTRGLPSTPPGRALSRAESAQESGHAAWLVLLEPASSPHVARITKAAADIGLPVERVETFEHTQAGAAILGLGPSIRDPLHVARELRRQGGRGLLVFFTSSSASFDALRAELLRDPFVYDRYELIELNDGQHLPARIGQVVERVERALHRPPAVRRGRRTRRAAAQAAGQATSEQYLANVLAQANDAIFSTDSAGRIITWNAAAERLFGYSSEAIVGRGLELLETGEAADDQLGAVVERALKSGAPQRAEFGCRHADGHELRVSASVGPMYEGGRLLGLSVIVHDESARVQAEEALRDAARQKDEFLAIISHELRTPLTSILGYTDMLLRGLSGPLPQQAVRYVGNVRAAGDRLLDLVNGLLDYSRLEAGVERLELGCADLLQLAQEVLDQLHGHAQAKQIHLRLEGEPDVRPVLGDAHKLRHVLSHYLSNALKFTPGGGWVAVRVGRDPEHQGMVRVSVADSGIGLRDEQLSRVWERFYQADASLTRAYGGMGIGLSIARHLVLLHGGKVGVESRGPGLGSTFWFSLPIAS